MLKFKSSTLKARKLKNFLILFILGAILAPIGDIVHVLSATTEYLVGSHHLIGAIPWWVPLQFGIATIIIGVAHHGFIRIRKLSLRECSSSAASLMFSYFVSGILPAQPWLSTAVILGLFLLNYLFLKDPIKDNILGKINNRYLLINSLLIAVVGTLIEVLLIRNGIFNYQHQFLDVPIWLPLLYAHASITVGSFTHFLEYN